VSRARLAQSEAAVSKPKIAAWPRLTGVPMSSDPKCRPPTRKSVAANTFAASSVVEGRRRFIRRTTSSKVAIAIVNGQNKPIGELYREVQKRRRVNPDLPWFRMPDEMTAAYIIDPSIFTETRRMYVDIDTTPGMHYAGSMFWDEVPRGYGGRPWSERANPGAQKPLPPPNTRVVNVLWDLDMERFKKLFIDLMSRPVTRKGSPAT